MRPIFEPLQREPIRVLSSIYFINMEHQSIQTKTELYSIVFNQVFVFIGVFFFDWTIHEALLLYWLEPILAWIVVGYVDVWTMQRLRPLPFGAAWGKWLAWGVGLTIVQGALLWAMDTVLQPIKNTWLDWEWWGFVVLFAVVMLLPIVLLERRGFPPSRDFLPTTMKILIHRLQSFTTYLILGVALAIYYATQAFWACIAWVVVSKLLIELFIFNQLQKTDSPTSY